MALQNLFIAFLGITSVIASQSSSATNFCIEALLTEPGNANDFCIQYLLLGTIPVPSFALPCMSTSPSDQQLFKSCYAILTQLAKETPLPTALHFDEIKRPSKRGKFLARDGGFFNTGSVSSVSTDAGIYENVGCFEDGVRGKPLGSPLLNLTGGPAETIQSCVNACSISGRNGIPYLYAGVEPGACWCSNYISILSIKSSSFCQSSCPSTFGKYCGGTVGGTLYMQVYELKNWSGNGNNTSTISVKTISSSSIKSSLTSVSQTFTSSSKLLTSTAKTTSTQKPASVSVPKSISFSSLVRSSVVSAVSNTSTTRKLSSSLSDTSASKPTALSSSPVNVGSTSSILSNRLSILTTSSSRVSSPSFKVSSPSPSGNSTSSGSSLTTSQVLVSRSSSISIIVSTPPEISQSINSASTVSESFVASETPSISLSSTTVSSATIHSFGLPPDPPTIPPIVGPTGTESYILPSGSFAYPSEVFTTVKPNPWASLSLKEPDYYTQIDSDAVPGDPLYTHAPLLPPSSLVVTSSATSTINNLNTISSSSSTSSTSLPRPTPSPDFSTIHVSTTTSSSPSTSSPSLNPTNPWAGLSLKEPDYYTQVPSDAVPGYVEPTTTLPIVVSETSSSTATSLPLSLLKKSKREYDVYAPDSPWASILPLTSPEIVKEVPPGQVPGWEQQAIAPSSNKVKREYDINSPDSPWVSLFPLSSPEIVKEVTPGQVPGWSQEPVSRAKREYDITAPDSPWLPLLPLSRPEIIKEVPPDQVPGWQGQPSAPLIPDSDVPPRVKPKGKLHRRQIGAIPENALEPPGRPDFIKEFPEKNNNKPHPPPFDKMKGHVDPKTGKKIERKKPKYSHSKISLKKRPSLKDIGLQQDGREIDSQGQIGKGDSRKRIKDHRYRHKLHLQGTPKAYSEMEEEIARRQRGEVKNTVEEWEKKILGGFGKAKDDGDEIGPLLKENAVISKVLMNDELRSEHDGEENLIWRKWSGGKRRGGRKIQLEKV
ncbi:hypothetical protein EYC84_010120 [Monilinia fructicola]|uniref:WSC domain-containing protein n=1 Tax=Monilinia fructicola TaxID=38448 RepID=A0A5M9JH27_MONFR|nr:hypothetical protein EYC84_010120 [Monilinia fructicola]